VIDKPKRGRPPKPPGTHLVPILVRVTPEAHDYLTALGNGSAYYGAQLIIEDAAKHNRKIKVSK